MCESERNEWCEKYSCVVWETKCEQKKKKLFQTEKFNQMNKTNKTMDSVQPRDDMK